MITIVSGLESPMLTGVQIMASPKEAPTSLIDGVTPFTVYDVLYGGKSVPTGA